MLAQEGSQSRRRRGSREAAVTEASIAKRRKPRPVSTVVATRVAPPPKLRKYSLNDVASRQVGVFLVERERERLEVEDGSRGSDHLVEGTLLDRNWQRLEVEDRPRGSDLLGEGCLLDSNSPRCGVERVGGHQVTGVVESRNQVTRVEEHTSEPQVTRVGESRFNPHLNNVVDGGLNPQFTRFEGSRLNPQVNNFVEREPNSHLARFIGSRPNPQLNNFEESEPNPQVNNVKERDPYPQLTRFGEVRHNPQVVKRDLNTQLARFGEGEHDFQVVESEINTQLTRFGENRHNPQVVESECNTKLEESTLNSQTQLNPQVIRVLEDGSVPKVTGSVGSTQINDNFGSGESTQINDNFGSGGSTRKDDEEVEVATPRYRPRSWYAKTTTTEEEQAKARRRKTHPGHHADYQEALSSLLWQPYECQRELTTVCSSPDDSDVAYWLGCRLPEFRIPREDEDLGSLSSRTSSSATIDVEVGVSDREEWLERLPPRAPASPSMPVSTGCRVSQAPDAGKNGSDMRSSVADSGPSVSAVASSQATTTTTNNVSLVRCYAATSVSSVPSIDCVVATSTSTNPVRTFTSTEAQTDDVVVDTAVVRPRERRRHTRRQQPLPPPTTNLQPLTPLTDRLPDILNSHLPPPYTTLPPPHLGLPPQAVPTHLPPPVSVPSIPVLTSPGSPPPPPAAVSNLVSGLRFPFAIVPAGRRRSRQFASSDEPKSCCGVVVSQAASVRWLMLLVLLVGLCCAFVGTLLLVTRAAGRDHLTLALLIIGVGVVLVGVSAAAWRLTSQDGPSCRAMLGLGGTDEIGVSEPNRRFVPRLPPSYGRPHHPYAAMMYPEFQYRAPPPSYQASMQEYRLRLLLLDRHTTPTTNSMSPPPTYRSQAGSLLRAPIVTSRRDLIHYQVAPSQQSDYSRPPSYRSRTSCSRGGPDTGTHSLSSHSRDPSQLSMTSDAGGVTPAAVNVITVMGGHPDTHHEETEPIIKLAPGDESLSPIAPKDDTLKDSNLVTIVQTSSQSTGPVIVTISGNADDGQTSRDTEMEILAHL